MGICKIYSLSKSNEKKYISNTSPLLWTNNESEAKIFRSDSEVVTDLYDHVESLEKMHKELGIELYIERL